MFRKTLFWIHLLTGVIAGLVILIMSVTGVLLTYEKQIVAWADRRAASVTETGSAPLNVETLLTAVHTNSGSTLESPTNVTLRSNPAEPVTLNLGGENMLVSPSDGLVLAPQDAGVRAFFRKITDWHRWLGVAAQTNPDARAPSRTTARAITGASNLMFLFLVVSGLYLWFPRKWRWQNVRAVMWFRGGLAGKARDFNWHNVAGFWCCVPLFFVVLSGAVISYPWASDLVYKAYGEQAPAGRNKGKEGKGKEGKGKAKGGPISTANLNALVAEAQRQSPTWKSIAFAPPATDDAPVTFNIDEGTGGQPQKKATLTLDRATAEVVRREAFTDQTPGRQTRNWMRFVHTGEYYGLLGQTIAGIASAGGALLVWTGIALAYRRFRAWMARDRTRAEAKEKEAVAA